MPPDLAEFGSRLVDDLTAHAVAVEPGQQGYTADFIDSATFDREDYQQTWLVSKVLVEGQPAVVGGSKKTLKTSICIDMAISLAAGTRERFLGKFDVENPRRVGVISGESGEATIRETARRICHSKRLDLSRLNVFWSFMLPQVSREEQLDKLTDAITANRLEVVILDPLYLSLLAGNSTASAANMFDMGPLLSNLSNACLNAGATPILVHHTKKLGKGDRFRLPELEDLAFAGVQEFARQWILLGRREAYEPGSGEHKLWLGVGGSAGHSGSWAVDINEGELNQNFGGRKWDVDVRTAGEEYSRADTERQESKAEKDQAQREQDIEKLRDALENYPDGETRNFLRDLTAIRGPRVLAALEHLVDAGEMEKTSITKRAGNGTRQHDAYRLVREEPINELE
jgi:replicative DNA helicase